MKKILIAVGILLAVSLFCQRDTATIDSLQSALSASSNKDKLNILSDLIMEYLHIDPTKSIDYGYQAIRLAEKLEKKNSKARFLSYIGVAYEYKGNYTKALEMYNESLDIAVSLEDKELEASALINIAVVNQNMRHYDESLNNNLQALELYRELDYTQGIASVLNNIGNVYLYLQQYEKALKYYQDSIDLKLQMENPNHLASTYQNIALVYQAMHDYENSIKYYDLSLEIMQKNNDRYDMAITYGNLANLYYLMNEYNKALFFINESLHLHQNLQNIYGVCSAEIQMAKILIKQKKFTQAEKHLQESQKTALENNLKELLSENYEAYSQYYQSLGKYQKSLEYFKDYKTLSDSLQNELNAQKLTELNIQYETAQKMKEIELLKQEAEHNKQTRNYLIYVVVFGVFVVVFLLNLYYEKIKDSKLKQEYQEKLQQSELKYRSLTENIKVAVFTYNTTGRFTYINKATSDTTGYSEKELLQMNFYDLVHPADREEVFKRGLAKIKGKKLATGLEFRIITKSGEVRWTETSSVRITIGGEFLVLGTSLDVTERNIAHHKLAESEAQLRALFAAMDDVIFTMDRIGTYVSIAPTNPELMYKPAKEVEGKRLHDVFPKEQADIFLAKVKECFDKQEMILFDYQLPIKNEKYWFDARLSPIDETKVLFVGRNITEKKESLQKLVDSEERYRNLVESIEEGMAIVDKDHNFIFVNNAATKIFGYSKDELVGMNVKKILTPEAEKKLMEQYKQRQKGISTKYENWNIRKDGEKRLLKISSSPLFMDDKFNGSVSIFSDITELRKAEEKIIDSLREKEVMLQEIYHRVKNNMQIISSMLKLQSRHINKENALEVFKNSQNRVKSMSLVHEKLYRSSDLARISAKDYFYSLLKQIFISYHEHSPNIKYSIDCDDIELKISSAIPCGLIANELITNSLKHAFDENGGNIFLKFNKIDNIKFKLEIGNDGKDFPADFSLENAESFGLQLVDILHKQLHAEFQLERNGGVNFIFIFEELKK
ncbi:MAG: PAS domain S-box protein [Candidatus Cloacimonetes bacterium]|nr:PAS domain S-box protein [Candidatus Cloacimonadota bacterium]MCF7814978.1 PAS domain S-box protein [Candidatus Cloacimonadota bacterium]MCF7869330.1 PAS domain S-box protein [Candidatus Cloacimonadota bacterium]MCF7884297.1 PAS domain S-box protein [Candidatus Cloacimonadota bacterium]